MTDHRRIRNGGSSVVTQTRIRRRDFVAGSLAAGTAALTGTKAWAQSGATVPLHCVPPLRPANRSSLITERRPASRPQERVELNASEITRLKTRMQRCGT